MRHVAFTWPIVNTSLENKEDRDLNKTAFYNSIQIFHNWHLMCINHFTNKWPTTSNNKLLLTIFDLNNVDDPRPCAFAPDNLTSFISDWYEIIVEVGMRFSKLNFDDIRDWYETWSFSVFVNRSFRIEYSQGCQEICCQVLGHLFCFHFARQQMYNIWASM